MFQTSGSGQILLRVFVVCGVLLSLVLLLQTVGTYLYVSGNLVLEEALSDAQRRALSLQRSMRLVDLTDRAEVDSILTAALTDWEETAGWLRILDSSGEVLAQSGATSSMPPLSPDEVRTQMAENRGESYRQVHSTDLGPVLVTAAPLRFAFPRGAGGRGVNRPNGTAPGSAANRGGPAGAAEGSDTDSPGRGAGATGGDTGPEWLEIAVGMDRVSAGFSPLRRNLVIGVSAALALLGTVLVIGIRFPHYLRGKKLEGQMALAHTVQTNLMPTPGARSRDAEIAAVCTPVAQLGGDFYDVFDLPGHQLGLMLGDVSGKGVAAAPLMAFIHGAAHASLWSESSTAHEEASGRLNELLYQKTAMERFVTLFWGYFDRDASVFRYVNAGHFPPLLIRSSADGTECVRLEEGGPVLGVIPALEYRQGSVEVREGDLLVMYSDGIVEATNAAGEEFGEDRILSAVSRCREKSAADIRDLILRDVEGFRNGVAAQDDQTLVVVRFRTDASYVSDDSLVATPILA